jgi:hypothetical protein
MHACLSAVFFLLQTEAAIAGDGKPCAAWPAHTQFAAYDTRAAAPKAPSPSAIDLKPELDL